MSCIELWANIFHCDCQNYIPSVHRNVLPLLKRTWTGSLRIGKIRRWKKSTCWGKGKIFFSQCIKTETNKDFIIRNNPITAAKMVVKDLFWFIEHFFPTIENQLAAAITWMKPNKFIFIKKDVFLGKILSQTSMDIIVSPGELWLSSTWPHGFLAKMLDNLG